MDLDRLRAVIVTIAAIGQSIFVLLYVAFPWWKSFLGRSLFFQAAALAVALDLNALARWYGWDRESFPFAVISASMAVGVWAQTVAFIKIMARTERKAWEAAGEREPA